MAKKDIKKQIGFSQTDLERLELLQKANEKTGKQLTINGKPEVSKSLTN